nr:MAG TPA: hypothetical protein [Caudoviricetes sp.]
MAFIYPIFCSITSDLRTKWATMRDINIDIVYLLIAMSNYYFSFISRTVSFFFFKHMLLRFLPGI